MYVYIYVHDVYNLRCISATKGRLYIRLRSFIDLKLSLEFFNEKGFDHRKRPREVREPSPRLRSVTQPVAGRAAAPGEISKAFWANCLIHKPEIRFVIWQGVKTLYPW